MISETFSIKPLYLLSLLYFFKYLDISSLSSSRFIYKLKEWFIIYNNLVCFFEYFLLNLFSIVRYKLLNILSYEQISVYFQFQRIVNAFELKHFLLKLFKKFFVFYHQLVAFLYIVIIFISGV